MYLITVLSFTDVSFQFTINCNKYIIVCCQQSESRIVRVKSCPWCQNSLGIIIFFELEKGNPLREESSRQLGILLEGSLGIQLEESITINYRVWEFSQSNLRQCHVYINFAQFMKYQHQGEDKIPLVHFFQLDNLEAYNNKSWIQFSFSNFLRDLLEKASI